MSKLTKTPFFSKQQEKMDEMLFEISDKIGLQLLETIKTEYPEIENLQFETVNEDWFGRTRITGNYYGFQIYILVSISHGDDC